MRSIEVELRYDGATAAQVYAMLAQPAFREKVCDFQRVLRKQVTITGSDPGMTVTVDQVQAAQGIPSFAKRFVGEEIRIVQTEQWSTPTAATVEVSIPGKPGEISGTVAIDQDAAGSTERVQMDVRVGIPLVGGKLEGLIADLLTKALHAENAVGKKWLGEGR